MVWILIAVGAAIVEIVVPAFGFIFGSLAAVAAALVSPWLGVAGQITVFAVVLIASLVLLRPRIVARLHTQDKLPATRAQALVGKLATVTEAIDPVTGRGRVLVEGEDWAARSSSALGAGSIVTVDGADAIVLVVSARDSGK